MDIPKTTPWGFLLPILRQHLWRCWWLYGLTACAFYWAHHHYRIALNMSNSLPQTVYLIELGSQPARVGDFVAFEWQRSQFYRRDWTFIKQVAGVAGQHITVHGRTVCIDEHPVGYAKPYSSKGNVALEPIAAGVIPNGYIYVAAAHPDSLDSRYRITGLIADNRVIGRAYVIF